MAKLTLQIHPSIKTDEIPDDFSHDFDEKINIINAMVQMLMGYPEMNNLVINDGDIKAGLMVFSGKTELTSMGLLNNELDEDIKIRIVPILHGG